MSQFVGTWSFDIPNIKHKCPSHEYDIIVKYDEWKKWMIRLRTHSIFDIMNCGYLTLENENHQKMLQMRPNQSIWPVNHTIINNKKKIYSFFLISWKKKKKSILKWEEKKGHIFLVQPQRIKVRHIVSIDVTRQARITYH